MSDEKPAQDQEPLLDRRLYDYIMNLGKIRNITDGGVGTTFRLGCASLWRYLRRKNYAT